MSSPAHQRTPAPITPKIYISIFQNCSRGIAQKNAAQQTAPAGPTVVLKHPDRNQNDQHGGNSHDLIRHVLTTRTSLRAGLYYELGGGLHVLFLAHQEERKKCVFGFASCTYLCANSSKLENHSKDVRKQSSVALLFSSSAIIAEFSSANLLRVSKRDSFSNGVESARGNTSRIRTHSLH